MYNQHYTDRERQGQPYEGLDLEKLKNIFLKSLPVIIGLIIISVFLAFLSIRYTRPLYESTSTIQLDFKSEAKVLGFKSFDEDINDLAREIEIIKSKLFLGKVADVLNYRVTYYQYGDILFEERYGNEPFLVYAVDITPNMYNRKIDLDILDNKRYKLSYNIGNQENEAVYNFDDTIKTDHLKIVVSLTERYDQDSDNRYFFTINTRESIVNYLGNNLEVEPLDFKAKTISVTFRAYNRVKVRDIVHAIDTLYIYYTQLEKNKANNQKIEFLNEQLRQTETKLTDLENYFENFTISYKTNDLDENLSKTIYQLEKLDSQKFLIKKRIRELDEANDNLLAGGNVDLNPVTMSVFNEETREEIQRLSSLLQELDVLLTSYNKNTLAYQKKNEEINFLKKRLLSYIESSRKELYNQLDELNARKKMLETQFVSLPSKKTEYSKTERYYALYEEFFLSLMKNKAEFELAQAGTTTNYKILSSATLPSAPISPNKFLYYGIGILAGLLLSFIYISIRYLAHNKITSQQELERLSPAFVLGSIPYYSFEKKNDSRLVVSSNFKSAISEAFRTIRTNLEFLNGHEEKPIIGITSTISGEGKTFVAANLGGIISVLDNKVIMIDLDMRKPRFHEIFENASHDKGLSTILIRKHEVTDCIHNTELENLDYIPAGPLPPNPSELILSDRFDDMIQQLKEMYDVIIIDTPPVGLVTDGIRALKMSSIPIYILRAEVSKKSFLKNVHWLIKVHQLKNMSLILNAVRNTLTGSYGKGYYTTEKTKKQTFVKKFFNF